MMGDTFIIFEPESPLMRGFSDDEREEIRNELVETARQLIKIHGFEKVTIQDVTEPVGIAESTFYRFFDSKAELFSEVLLRESDLLFDAVEAELVPEDPPEERLKRLLEVWAEGFEDRPLLMESHQSPENVMRYVDEETLELAQQRYVERAVPIVKALQAESDGLIAELHPMLILNVLSVIELVVAQKPLYEEFGDIDYERFQDTLQRVLVRGLLVGME